jgi:phage tail-like protein
MAVYYPPVGFHFKVEFSGLNADADTRFSDVAGLSAEMATEEVAEGGENRFVQKYPTRAKYPELVLKRGLLRQTALADWINRCLLEFRIEPLSVDIKLLNEQHDPLMTWHVIGAYPTKWSVSDFNASGNAIVVESLQLAYQYFTVDRS